MKRPLTIVGGILGTGFTAFWVGIMLVGVAALLDILSGVDADGVGSIALVAFLEIAFGVVAIVLNAISISGFSCSKEKYASKRRVIIAAIVFDFLLALLLVFSLFNQFSAINMIVALACIASGVLYIVDLCLEGKRIERFETAASEKAKAPAGENKKEPEENAAPQGEKIENK